MPNPLRIIAEWNVASRNFSLSSTDKGYRLTIPGGRDVLLTTDEWIVLAEAIEHIVVRGGFSRKSDHLARAHTRWPENDDRELIDLAKSGTTLTEIALHFQRTNLAVLSRAVRLGVAEDILGRNPKSQRR